MLLLESSFILSLFIIIMHWHEVSITKVLESNKFKVNLILLLRPCNLVKKDGGSYCTGPGIFWLQDFLTWMDPLPPPPLSGNKNCHAQLGPPILARTPLPHENFPWTTWTLDLARTVVLRQS